MSMIVICIMKNANCVIENNIFENNVSQSYSPSVVWGGNAEIKDNIFYTKKEEH